MGTPSMPCEHGKVVSMDAPAPGECQLCDWCPRCEAVRRYDGETCAACGYVWGSGDDATPVPYGRDEAPVGHRVWCTQHHLHRTVGTEQHAMNLLALHLRVDHADDDAMPSMEVNLTAAAGHVVMALDVGGTVAAAAVGLFATMLDVDEAEAISLAHELATTDPDVLAHVAPF